MHEGLICLWLGFMTCFMLSLRHERHAANLPPCSALPPWQSWQPCLPPGWSVCRARCCWWWRGLRTWGCRALGSGCVLQTAAAHLRRPLKCQVERVNNTKSFRHARNSVFNLKVVSLLQTLRWRAGLRCWTWRWFVPRCPWICLEVS